MKKYFLISVLALFMASCGNAPKPDTNEQANAAVETPTEVTVGNFKEKAGGLVDKLVVIKGTADHICKHDGKKLFLIDTLSEGRVKVVTGDDMAAFNSELEGFDFVVTGLVEETVVDEAYLQEWEEEIKAGIEEKKHLEGGKKGEAEAEAEDDHHSDESAFESINNYRKMMAEQGVTKLSFYNIKAVSYEVIKE